LYGCLADPSRTRACTAAEKEELALRNAAAAEREELALRNAAAAEAAKAEGIALYQRHISFCPPLSLRIALRNAAAEKAAANFERWYIESCPPMSLVGSLPLSFYPNPPNRTHNLKTMAGMWQQQQWYIARYMGLGFIARYMLYSILSIQYTLL
jgi:regulator of protease activity HflC (stomatin/prohibitin superfamily)